MAERLVVASETITYTGVFDGKDLWNVVKQWSQDKGYFIIEIAHNESVLADGKFIDFDLLPFKKYTDYAKSVVKMRMQYQHVKDVVVERDGKKLKLLEGKVFISMDGILETDYEHRWESKPLFYTIRTIFEKYVYTPFMSGFERGVKEDMMALKNNIKAFLNLTKFV